MLNDSLGHISVLAAIPSGLRSPLLTAYDEIVKNYRESRWEPSALNGGKLCEVIYSIVHGYVTGNMPATPKKPRNMLDACQALEKMPKTELPGDRSARIQIPRILAALYEIRNNRGIGHVGADVDPNHMDATFVLYSAKWLMAELVRIFHKTTTSVATRIVEDLIERVTPVVWNVNGQRRVMDHKLNMRQKTLLLLYDVGGSVLEADLFQWVEHSNASVFRRDVLRKAHTDKLLEYDRGAATVTLSPKGADYVEKSGLLSAVPVKVKPAN